MDKYSHLQLYHPCPTINGILTIGIRHGWVITTTQFYVGVITFPCPYLFRCWLHKAIFGVIIPVPCSVNNACYSNREPEHFVYLCATLTSTVYPKKYAHGFCFAVFCCGYTLTDFPISIRLTSLALWQSNDCPSASKATLMNMDKYFMWIHYERLRNHNKAMHNKTVCIFLGIYCSRGFHWK